MKYNTKSADVLNEADRMEDILNFKIACEEQELMLWSDPADWVPGTPIMPYIEYEDVEWYDDESGRVSLRMVMRPRNHDSVYVRPMIQELGDTALVCKDLVSWDVRCDDCLVSWSGPDACFMCGKHAEDPNYYHKNLFADYDFGVDRGVLTVNDSRDVLSVSSIRHEREDHIPGSMGQMLSWLRAEMQQMLYAEMDTQMSRMLYGDGESSPSVDYDIDYHQYRVTHPNGRQSLISGEMYEDMYAQFRGPYIHWQQNDEIQEFTPIEWEAANPALRVNADYNAASRRVFDILVPDRTEQLPPGLLDGIDLEEALRRVRNPEVEPPVIRRRDGSGIEAYLQRHPERRIDETPITEQRRT